MASPSDKLLETYRQMRDFSRTPEPKGDSKEGKRGTRPLRFVIQKHDASRLHYDFRLELDGVLKSWAVTKGPSLNPADKRLAVRTEDHPLEYQHFEGIISEGCGAGTVLLWDRGEWVPRNDAHEGLEKGSLKFELKGERLTGGWALVRMKGKPGAKRQNWLLIKERDEAADETHDPRDTWTESIATSHDLKEIEHAAAAAQGGTPGNGTGRVFPDFVVPQLASLRDSPPAGPEWLHEVKFDGYRIQALIADQGVRLMTRNGKDWTDRFPNAADALSSLAVASATIDGELVALTPGGHSDFSALQAAMKGGVDARLAYYAFDLLFLNGKDLRKSTLVKRKSALREIIPAKDGMIRFSDHIEGQGDEIIERACGMHFEGIVSKKGNARYMSGRGTGWIKSKCVGRDEFVIGGYRRSNKRDRPFASLLLGEFQNGKLIYRGRVGTGFSQADMEDLAERLSNIKRKTPAFGTLTDEARHQAVWVRPTLVCEIAYAERTPDGLLRHPAYLGLRSDKAAEKVITEMEKQSGTAARSSGKGEDRIGSVALTHPDRVVYERAAITKRDVAVYLNDIAPRMLPYLKDRPVSFLRCPSGTSGECFFQKHHTGSVPDRIGQAMIEESDGKTASYLVLRTAEGIVAAAQIGTLEYHIWGARTDRLDRPDRFVIDLDPGEGLAFDDVKHAALEVREVLNSAGLRSFALLTGGKGIHVVVPLERRRGWEEIKGAARGLAHRMAEGAPDRYVADMSKAKRKGKIFIDWLRNERGATAVSPFSLRARPGAPIATPVRWNELPHIESANAYTLSNIRQRLSQLKTDPWQSYDNVRQSISNEVLAVLSRQS